MMKNNINADLKFQSKLDFGDCLTNLSGWLLTFLTPRF